MTVSLAHAERFFRRVADQPDLPNALPGANDTRDSFRRMIEEVDRLRAQTKPDRDAIVRAVKHWTEDDDRCDMQDREEQVADTILAALRGEDLDQ